MSHRQFPVFSFIFSLTVLMLIGVGASHAEDSPKLLGRCTVEQLAQAPFAEWFDAGYAGYTPHTEVLEALRDADTAGLEIEIFFGTWCGDSKREVPRLLKLLDALAFPARAVHLVAVDREAGMLKRSPGGEEQGLEIYRVPTVVVRRGGVEVARMVEYPSLSLERDLLAIVSGAPYTPSYASYPTIHQWLKAGLLTDPNVSADGLADRVRAQARSEWEIASAAQVLLDRGDVPEAVKLFEVNGELFPESAARHAQLAEALLAAGDRDQAAEVARAALRWSEDEEASESLVQSLEQALASQ